MIILYFFLQILMTFLTYDYHIHKFPPLRRKATEGKEYNITLWIAFVNLRESLPLCANSNNSDLASITGDRRCVHGTPEGHLHQQLDDRPPTQRKQQDQYQERSATRRYHIAEDVYGSTRKHIPTTSLSGLKLDGRISYSSSLRRRHTYKR